VPGKRVAGEREDRVFQGGKVAWGADLSLSHRIAYSNGQEPIGFSFAHAR
jgi:hypothetical protein